MIGIAQHHLPPYLTCFFMKLRKVLCASVILTTVVDTVSASIVKKMLQVFIPLGSGMFFFFNAQSVCGYV